VRAVSRKKTAVLTAIVVVALVAAALLAASCGGKTTTSSTSSSSASSQTQVTSKAQIDQFLNDLDQQIKSVNPDDFNDNELSNQSLGY